jgi:O-antigen/teichoic acid export membrane protein
MPVENLGNRISGVMFSSFARRQEERQRLIEYLEKSLVLLSTLCFPIFIGLFTIAPIFVTVLLGQKWEPMTRSLEILLLAMMVGTLANHMGTMNISVGNYKSQIRRKGFCLFILTVACLWLVRYGIDTIAFVFLGYQLVLFTLSFQLIIQKLQITSINILRSIMPPIIGTILMAAVIAILKYFVFPEKTFLNLLLFSCLGIFLYSTSQFVLRTPQTAFLVDEVSIIFKRVGRRIRMTFS